MEESKESKIPNIFRLPHIQNGNSVESTLILVLDSSGSMSSYWKYVAENCNKLSNQKNLIIITFSTNAKIVNLPLTDRVQDYEGGGTEIEAGFRLLNDQLKLSKTKDNITILFVSDGADNNSATLSKRLKNNQINIDKKKKINFLSVGVGRGFPTFVAMSLREMYHSGENNIPPVFLIETPGNQIEWLEIFESMNMYFSHQSELSVSPYCQLFPWTQETQKAFENSWVISQSEKLLINETEIITKCEQFCVSELIDISKCWLSQLQLTSLKQDVKQQASTALKILNNLKDIVQKEIKETKKVSFLQRINKKLKGSFDQDLQILLKEIKNLCEENILSQLSPEEAAKRLAIGTKIGKYHDKAMKIRGYTIEDFNKDKEYFIKILKETKLNPETGQEASIISMETQKEVFMQSDLIQGLKMCPSQYDLVESLTLVGHAIKVKRTDGSMINPYLIQIVDMAKHHKVIDTVSIQQEGGEIQLAVGEGDFEIVNAVLPLFDQRDADLKPLITSKLYQALMTFNTMNNVDTCFDNAYIALMSNAFVYLVNQSDSEWKRNMLKLLFETIKITFSDLKFFKNYSQQLLEQPRIAVVTEHPDIQTKCEDLSKPLFFMFYQVNDGIITNNQQKEQCLFSIFAEVFGRFYPSDQNQVSKFFKLKNEEILKQLDYSQYIDQVYQEFPQNLLSFYTLQELKNKLSEIISKKEIKLNIEFEVEINWEKLWFMKDGFKYSKTILDKIWKFFLGEEQAFDEKYFWYWLYHSNKYKNSYERNKSEMLTNYEQIYQSIKEEIIHGIIQENPVFDICFKKFEFQYKKQISELHLNTQPFLINDLKQNLKKLEKESDLPLYKFNQVSNLLINACCSPKCPFFLQINPSLSGHMEAIEFKFPAFHKTCKIFCDAQISTEEIFKKILKGECLDYKINAQALNLISPFAMQFYQENPQIFYPLIEDLVKYYQIVKKNEITQEQNQNNKKN